MQPREKSGGANAPRELRAWKVQDAALNFWFTAAGRRSVLYPFIGQHLFHRRLLGLLGEAGLFDA